MKITIINWRFQVGSVQARLFFALSWAICLGAGALQATDGPWPLGTLTTNSASDSSCPPGYVCRGFTVSTPGVTDNLNGFLAIGSHQGNARGLVVVFTGGGGTGYWTAQQPEIFTLGEELRALGFTVVQVRWARNWLESSPGNDAGQARLGCRPATVIKYIHDTYYLPLGVQPRRAGEAGFAVTGNSGGATQTGYALSHYGLDEIIDVAMPTGGPPHAALAKSCMTNQSENGYWFGLGTRQFIDRGFGFFDGNGPAARHDPDFIPRWLEASHSTGGNDYYHERTRVHFIIGQNDAGMRTIAGDYFNRLKAEGTPFVAWELAPGTPHLVVSTEAGRAAFKAALFGTEILNPVIADGALNFQVNGLTNFNYVVQSSLDLQSWIAVRTNRGSFSFVETNATAVSNRFYRLLRQP